jgi:hypothetical protein
MWRSTILLEDYRGLEILHLRHYKLLKHVQIRDCLDATFPNRWLGRDGPIAWPPRSPDITPLHFFLWGYVKDKVYATKVTGVEGLKTRTDQGCHHKKSIEACWLAHGKNWNFDRKSSVRHRVPTLKCAEWLKKLHVCIHQIKLVSHFSWQFIIFNWIVKLVKDFWPTLYNVTYLSLIIFFLIELRHNTNQIFMTFVLNHLGLSHRLPSATNAVNKRIYFLCSFDIATDKNR